MKIQKRQGDLLIRSIDKLPDNLIEQKDIILASNEDLLTWLK
jgi:hypothetical protein